MPRRSCTALGFAALAASTVSAQMPTWANATARPSPRSSHSVAFDEARGRLVTFGGDAFGETWERGGDVWVQRTPAHHPPARDNGALAYDPVRAVTVLYGGVTPAGVVLQDTWEWDGTDWRQVATPQSPPPLTTAGMTWHGGANPGTLLHGGFLSSGATSRATWQFDGSNWTLRAANGPDFAGSCIAYASSTQRTYAYISANGLSWELWSWDGNGWNLVATAATGTILAPGVTNGGMAFDPDCNALVIAGASSTSLSITPSPTPQFNFPAYVAAESAWGVMWRKLAYDTARRTVVAFGGIGTFLPPGSFAVQMPVNDLIELPSNSTGNWIVRRSLAGTPTGRVYTDMTFDATLGQMVLFGGRVGRGDTNETWTFDGTTWTNRGAGLPAPREQPALAYEASLGTVLFGGGTSTGAYFGDTLYWLGAGWSYRFGGSAAPSARRGHDMVGDPTRSRILLYGGYNGTTLADTWQLKSTWYGPEWTQVATIGSPGPRQSHAMAYDQKRRRVVLFGGADSNGQFLGDTWELFDGRVSQTWTRVTTPTSPPRRWAHAMTYDVARGLVVLTGGYGDPQCGNYCARYLDDVWEYDGSNWRQRAPSTSLPSAREGAGFAYDPVRQRSVLQGGRDSWLYPTETWYYDAPLDRVAPAGAAGTLECTRFPAAGSQATFSFPSVYGYGWILITTPTGGGLPSYYGSLCSPSALLNYPDLLYGGLGQPCIAGFVVPTSLVGHSFTAQGMWLAATGCFAVSDALVVTVRAP